MPPWRGGFRSSAKSVTNLQSVGFVTTTGCGSALIKIKSNVHCALCGRILLVPTEALSVLI